MGASLDELLADPRHPDWGQPGWPAKIAQFRPAQQTAIAEIVSLFEQGTRVVALQAPTGAGKTAIGEAVRRALQTRALYMCVDKGLQDQFRTDFTYAQVIKGRVNYPTLNHPGAFELRDEHRLTADDCNRRGPKRPCTLCDPNEHCPYRLAKHAAQVAPLTCINTAYFMQEANTAGVFKGWPLVIADEGDRLEDALMAYAEVAVSYRRLLELNAPRPPAGATDAEAADWIEHDVLPAVDRQMAKYDPETDDVHEQRELRALTNMYDRLQDVQAGLRQGWWVRTESPFAAVFKPIHVRGVAAPWLWENADQWLVMSATLLNPGRLLRDLGISESWAVVRMPSSFPVANRPVHLVNAAHVTRDNEDLAVMELGRALRRILARHRHERVLVHTVSYRLMERLAGQVQDESGRVLTLANSRARAATLEQYLARPDSVLLAPALERGVDLPDDACRVAVVAKIPWPNLGDAQVKARMEGRGGLGRTEGREWYTDMALRSLVQMTGRGVRHEADYCTSYILDAQIERVLSQYRSRLPAWWLEAIVPGDPS